MSSFSATISKLKSEKGSLEFTLEGSDEYGLDKSIVNSLRRTLLSEIPCVAFRIDEEQTKDLVIETNNTSLHNEYLMHRLAMVPIYLDPQTYEKQYLFYLNVKHDGSEPYKFVTTDDIAIYPLKDGEMVGEEISLDNYDMNKPLSKSEHNKILRTFSFRGKDYPILLTELKSTNVVGQYQELVCYGVPSVSDGREHAAWKAVSDATYTFLENDELFTKVANDKANQKQIIDDKERKAFIEELRVAEYERYFYRDVNNEPNRYKLKITSQHYNNSSELFVLANEVMISKLETLKQHFINLVKGGSTSIVVEETKNENNYLIQLMGQNDTIGNVLQSHIVNHYTEDDSLLSFCGYKKSHPLEEYVSLYIGYNPKNEAFSQSEEFKLNTLVKFMDDVIEDLIGMYREIMTEATKVL
jgi:DNA-directed RNA polymerase alpha subunit/DNA-directed RNA polymerase subunit L